MHHALARGRYLIAATLAAAFMSSTALAQTTTPPAATSRCSRAKLSPHWRSSKMIGLNVYNEQNERLGDINEIILDKDGKAMGYVIGVGGFLGMGEHDILVEPGKIKFVNEPVAPATSATNPPANPPATTRTDTPPAPRAANEQWYPDHGMLNATKDQLKAMPQFKYSSYN